MSHSTTGGAGLQVVVGSVGLSQHHRWGRTTGGEVCGPCLTAPQVGQDYRWWGLWACHSTTGGAGLQVVRSVGLSQHNRWGRTTGGGGVCGPLTAPQVGQDYSW